MKREIKFRGWDNYSKYMIGAEYGNWLSFDGVPYEDAEKKGDTRNIEIERSKDIIPLQFTGFKDQNGREIYEGDIIQVGDEQDGEISPLDSNTGIGDVCFLVSSGIWYVNKLENGLGDLHQDYTNIEVIGNIYQNPNLLT